MIWMTGRLLIFPNPFVTSHLRVALITHISGINLEFCFNCNNRCDIKNAIYVLGTEEAGPTPGLMLSYKHVFSGIVECHKFKMFLAIPDPDGEPIYKCVSHHTSCHG